MNYKKWMWSAFIGWIIYAVALTWCGFKIEKLQKQNAELKAELENWQRDGGTLIIQGWTGRIEIKKDTTLIIKKP